MKFTHMMMAALAGTSLALPDFDCPATTGLPECGVACLIGAALDIGCEFTDVACQCSSTSQLEEIAASCVLQACTDMGAIEQLTSAAQAICETCNTATATANTAIPVTNVGRISDTWAQTTEPVA
ncbi:hypothetical protein QBC37DRAFT_449599 [Rhypophila decipiens]|uniref:CFEM domain-containing protein n=1 Tax=Rhypophila decipiens TaxID=261697 RepID=A0AAN6YDR2_9PEZI|nr:hypothetical protein QBC37DRAFT_449599 [Rhypophila decipiens]